MALKQGEKNKRRKSGLANAVSRRSRRLTGARREAPPPPDSVHPVHLPASPNERQASHLPADLFEEAEPADLANQPPVMLIITVLAVAFIGVITWFVAHMPAK